jgi:hypothetical protein
MSNLEDNLKAALERTEPSPEFTGRVLARLNGQTPRKLAWWEMFGVLLRPPRIQWVALSVTVSIMIPFAGVQYQKERRLRAEGEKAKDQLVFAVHVAGNKLHRVQQKVLEIGRMDTRL